MIFFLKKNLLTFGYYSFFFWPLGTVIVKMKLDVQYSEKLFLGNFQKTDW